MARQVVIENPVLNSPYREPARHFRFDESTKVVVGRNAAENASLRRFAEREDASQTALVEAYGFPGPTAVVVGDTSDRAVAFAGGLTARFGGRAEVDGRKVRATHRDRSETIRAEIDRAAGEAQSL